jgi:DnaJ-class molecular chaperone
MTDFQITLPCADCKNTGEIEHQVAVDHFHVSICPNCWGNGFKTYTEMYDCIEDARLDYPEALGIEIEVGHNAGSR